MKLTKVVIHKYKSYENDQEFEVDQDVTILVGMNESGKTAALEAIAKTNYFQENEKFEFNLTHDYPRRDKKKIDKSGENPEAITCSYQIPDWLLAEIAEDVGENVFESQEFAVITKYKEGRAFLNVIADKKKFIGRKTKSLGISSNATNEKLEKITSKEEFDALAASFKDEKYLSAFSELKKYFEFQWGWKNPVQEYITRVYLVKNLPKFLYYDEYFSLPSRISIEKLDKNQLDQDEYKTAKAFFELADINVSELLSTGDFEDFIAELEATEAIISDELFKYWQTNKNLQIVFRVEPIEKTDPRNNTRIVEHVLDIRVKNKGVSLPLRNRSKGFNWFFSFLVWFKKIQEDNSSNYILLLDEPGLNLHASAQADLLRFLDDLSQDYQIVYTTHSPFMISPEKLNRVRTVLETEKGSVVSDSLQEKDPNTLFPLQAALGYDIAQNLFISPKNLLVEGVSDLTILTALSGVLEAENRTGLRSDITIVPTGGLEKVATFISLLRGSDLEIACLLDSYADATGKAKMDKIVREKIIAQKSIRFFNEFLEDYSRADIEDLFAKEDYLKLFNFAFSEIPDVQLSDLNSDIQQIIIQINKHLGKDRFNHYRPAKELVKHDVSQSFFSIETLDNFEKVFEEINSLFE